MRCPKCNGNDVCVTDSMTSDDNKVRRRRKCSNCGFIFRTIEVIVDETKGTKHTNEFERRICPFCGQAHIGKVCINTLCVCGAKYYPCTDEWLNRETGEIKKGSE